MRKIIVAAPQIHSCGPVGEEKVLVRRFGLMLVEQRFRGPDGTEDDFVFCRKVPGVTICTITTEKNLVLVGQYKQGSKMVVYEFPAGMVWDVGNSEMVEAKDELREETGYEVVDIVPLCATPSRPGPRKFDTCEYLYVATGARQVGSQQLDAGEKAMEVIEVDPLTFVQMREAGEIVSSGTREAFGLAWEKGYIDL